MLSKTRGLSMEVNITMKGNDGTLISIAKSKLIGLTTPICNGARISSEVGQRMFVHGKARA